jgi:hypothetical protein
VRPKARGICSIAKEYDFPAGRRLCRGLTSAQQQFRRKEYQGDEATRRFQRRFQTTVEVILGFHILFGPLLRLSSAGNARNRADAVSFFLE